MKELIGLKIIKLEIGNSENALRFTTKDGALTYVCEGDCCSETWFSEILDLDCMVNHTISEVQDLILPDWKDGHGRQLSDKFYGFRITSEVGYTTVVYRNSSNGYYGGNCYLANCKSLSCPDKNCLACLTHIKDCRICRITDWTSIGHSPEWTAYQPTNNSFNKFLKLKAFL